MKHIVGIVVVVGAMIALSTGCTTTVADQHRSDLKTELVPAKFKPQVEVLKDKGLAKGTAKKSYWFWFFNKDTPSSFAHEIVDGFNGLTINTVANAAVYDACHNSGASIILAPRFTVTKETSFLWFSGELTINVEGVPARVVGAEEIPVEQWPVIFGSRSGTIKQITEK